MVLNILNQKEHQSKLKQTPYLLIVWVGNLLREETCWSFNCRISEIAQHHSFKFIFRGLLKSNFQPDWNFKRLLSLEFLYSYNIKHDHFPKWSWASLSFVHLRFALLKISFYVLSSFLFLMISNQVLSRFLFFPFSTRGSSGQLLWWTKPFKCGLDPKKCNLSNLFHL